MATPSDISQPTGGFQNSLISRLQPAVEAGRVPGLGWTDRFGHWGLRIPVTAVLLNQAMLKFPDVFLAPGDYGVPAPLFILAGFGELLGSIVLLLGGVFETWRPKAGWLRLSGDVLTRAGGLAGSAAILGVMHYFLAWDVPLYDVHVILLGITLFFALRGNKYGAHDYQ